MNSSLEARIRKHEADLTSRHPCVTACRVSVEDRPPHLYERRRFNVRLDIGLSRHEIVVNREHDEDPGSALLVAFEAANQQLEALAGSRRSLVGTGARADCAAA
jgi:hypothetical protein